MKTRLVALIVAISAGTVPAQAHDVVLLLRSPDALTIKFGHPGEYEPADLNKLIELKAYAAGSGKGVSLLDDKPKKAGMNWKLPGLEKLAGGPVALVTAQYDNGYWVGVSKDKFYNTSKLHIPKGQHAGYFFKFSKGFSSACKDDYKLRAGHRLEIIPQSNPMEAKPGDKLAVKVLWEGAPLPGVGVEIGDGKTKMKEEDIPRYKTDVRGIAKLPFEKAGLHIVAIDYPVAPKHSDLSDHDEYSASLTFETR
jgi:nickel transport protein